MARLTMSTLTDAEARAIAAILASAPSPTIAAVVRLA
jgi:hypothetical protein